MIGHLALLLVSACGGVAAGDNGAQGAQQSGGAPSGGVPSGGAPSGDAGAPADTLTADQIQVVDDVDHAPSQYPEPPPGSSAFFWRGGLGNWFVSASDGSATRDARTEDVTPPRRGSARAYHVSETNAGTTIDLWAQLNHPQGTGVDLGAYAGIAFWARLNDSKGALTVAFSANGRFTNIGAAPQKMIPASADWKQFVVRFDEVGIDASAVSSIDFVVEGAPFELWVDDLALVCRGSCP